MAKDITLRDNTEIIEFQDVEPEIVFKDNSAKLVFDVVVPPPSGDGFPLVLPYLLS